MKTLTKLFTATVLTIGLLVNSNHAKAGIDGYTCKMESVAVVAVFTIIKLKINTGIDKEQAFKDTSVTFASRADNQETRKMVLDTLDLTYSYYNQIKDMNVEQIKAFTFNQCVNNSNK